MIILLDQDGVLADFEHAFIDAWRARHPDVAPVAFENRKSFYIREDDAPELRAMA
jgi:5'-nucleotidase